MIEPIRDDPIDSVDPIWLRTDHPFDDRDHCRFIRFEHRDHRQVFRGFGIWNRKNRQRGNTKNNQNQYDNLVLVSHGSIISDSDYPFSSSRRDLETEQVTSSEAGEISEQTSFPDGKNIVFFQTRDPE